MLLQWNRRAFALFSNVPWENKPGLGQAGLLMGDIATCAST